MTMRVLARVGAKELRVALQRASGVIERRTTVPVLGMARIDFRNRNMMVRGTDLDIEVGTKLEISEKAMRSVMVPPRPLLRMIGGADKAGEHRMNEADKILEGECDGMVAAIQMRIQPGDYPEMKGATSRDTEEEPTLAASQGEIATMLDRVMHAISTQETRYYLNGIFLHTIEGQICAVATDGHRLARYLSPVAGNTPPVIVPRKVVGVLCSMLSPAGNGPVRAWVSSETSHWRCDNWFVVAKNIDGRYPSYDRVIPSPSDEIEVSISRSAVNRLPPTGGGEERAVTIDPAEGTMATHDAYGMEGVTFTAPVQKGKGRRFGLNLRYLRSIFQGGQSVTIMGRGPGDPLRVLTDDPRLIQVLMPMRI
jgi:DNA polymerase-3 subunit beta